MTFWDDVQRGVTNAASFTAKKTTELTGMAKLKYNLHIKEGKLEKCFAEIGKLHYAAKKDGEDHSVEIDTFIMQIDKLTEDIGGLKIELSKLKNTYVCDECFAEISKDCTFCPVCGEKIDTDEE